MKVDIGMAVLAASGLVMAAPISIRAAEVPAAATTACLTAVNSNYGGNVGDLKVASSEFSEANSIVMVKALRVRGTNKAESWKCLVSNRGQVQELTMASSGSSHGHAGAAVSEQSKSACMARVNDLYGGNVRDLQVTRTKYEKPNSVVVVRAIGERGGSTNQKYRCLVSNTGTVQDLKAVSH
jgi:hypothetical protein